MISPQRELERRRYINEKNAKQFKLCETVKTKNVELPNKDEAIRQEYVHKKKRVNSDTKARFTEFCIEHGYFK